ncbi:MAG: type II toxin-antitoxin system HicA family toxin [Deltaproteobacteria bacterium]|nr:type II toxin-antitoxin system HicA family toxin [Deltaproteobacteria bacterium]
MTFAELVRLLEANGFEFRRENGSKRFYGKPGFPGLIQVDFHGKKEVPRGTLHKILKDAAIKR